MRSAELLPSGLHHHAAGYPFDVREGVVAVIRRAERLLVIKRGATVPMPGYWSPLSGKIERGETQGEVREAGAHVPR
jgi:8-oxo-dGTP pyrophosphatase MutT (NUDIX family)